MGDDVTLLDKWYTSDSNNIPPVSILQPIDSHLKHFLNKKNPDLQNRDASTWWGIQAKLQGILLNPLRRYHIKIRIQLQRSHRV